MQAHDEIAEHLAADLAATLTSVLVADTTGARQGDVVIDWAGECAERIENTAPRGGYLLAAGKHGEHRLCGSGFTVDNGKIRVGIGGLALLVHTDSPTDRHGPIRIPPGCWTVRRERELDVNLAVRNQED